MGIIGSDLSTKGLLFCIGLAVGVGLCFIAWVAYDVEVTSKSGGASVAPSSLDGAWFGVPYTKIDRESFGDPVSNIMDVGRIPKEDEDPRPPPKLPQDQTATIDGDLQINQSHSFGCILDQPRHAPSEWKGVSVADEKPPLTPSSRTRISSKWSSLVNCRRPILPPVASPSQTIQDEFAPDITLDPWRRSTPDTAVQFDSRSVTLRFYSAILSTLYSGLFAELRALSDFNDILCPRPFRREKQRSSNRNMARNQISTDIVVGFFSLSSSCFTATAEAGFVTQQQIRRRKESHHWCSICCYEEGRFDVACIYIGTRTQCDRYNPEKYTGVIRLALIPPTLLNSAASNSDGSSVTKSLDVGHLSSSSGVKRLIYHAGTYPVKGAVSWDFRSGTRSPLASFSSPKISVNKAHGRRAIEQNVTKHRMTADSPKDNNIGTIIFSFDTNHMTASSPSTNVPLLMLALPHHAASISSAEALLLRRDDFDLTYHSIKGQMVPVVGNTWSYEEELTSIGFGNDPMPSSSLSATGTSATSQHYSNHESTAISALDQSIRDLILNTVESDLKVNLPDLSSGAYSFGKQIARLAQLAHIAEVVGAANMIEIDTEVNRIKNKTEIDLDQSPISSSMPPPLDTAPSKSSSPDARTTTTTTTTTTTATTGAAARAFALLEKYLIMWLAGGSDERLVYDAQLGGILSKVGTEDINADFGNGRYNDHHFHYGYVLFASAILGRANPQFVSQYGLFVDALFYDVAHNGFGNDNIFFPLARHKSWFDGHSFASGLFPFADGKSQESSSEAVNCYYGAYLWSRVRWGGKSDRKMVDYARLLLATEMTGAKTYWHMMPPEEIKSGEGNDSTSASSDGAAPVAYNPLFRKNFMVGNLGMTDVTCTTWFGTENIYVHLINFMPVTPMTSELFDKGYVRGERSVLSSNNSLEIAWKGYSICNEAIIYPNKAWTEAQSLVSTQLDPGISKSQVLFWVSTREDFSPATTAEVSFKNDHGEKEMPTHPATRDSISSASCSSYLNCLAAKLQGSCCPTDDGIMLGCCS
ncbi:LOW QUALITY PROTEIN: hypothetical protein ACHAW5_009219 [Stephanodiscus triporus]|uniref:glucan endo-1,3-beta-D-glucosidase n=1 Tax=Stephanodiscus triporus TaxID=2934178 RepID=A0ABD3PLD7_9STRA